MSLEYTEAYQEDAQFKENIPLTGQQIEDAVFGDDEQIATMYDPFDELPENSMTAEQFDRMVQSILNLQNQLTQAISNGETQFSANGYTVEISAAAPGVSPSVSFSRNGNEMVFYLNTHGVWIGIDGYFNSEPFAQFHSNSHNYQDFTSASGDIFVANDKLDQFAQIIETHLNSSRSGAIRSF